MSRCDKAQKIQCILDELFPSPEIPLNHKNAYTLLVAVLLSAQCTDKRVNVVTKELFSFVSTPQEMVALGRDKIEEIIRSCGLAKTKAKALWGLSQKIIEEHSGIVPSSFEALEALPGVGHKTASVVMIQAFNKPAFPVDTHILRCAQRWGLTSCSTPEAVEKELKKMFPKKTWAKLHLQMIYFARKYCPARGHDPKQCPICSWV
jgi:endonuclease III